MICIRYIIVAYHYLCIFIAVQICHEKNENRRHEDRVDFSYIARAKCTLCLFIFPTVYAKVLRCSILVFLLFSKLSVVTIILYCIHFIIVIFCVYCIIRNNALIYTSHSHNDAPHLNDNRRVNIRKNINDF